MTHDLSRRELLLRGAFAGAALALPGAEALAAVRDARPKRSVHCMPPEYRFQAKSIVSDCSFLAYAPDGLRLALATSRGVEIFDSRDGSRRAVTPPGFSLAAGAWHPDGSVLLASGPAPDAGGLLASGAGGGRFLYAIDPASGAATRLLPDHPGEARAACFSPDGKKVAFTYLNRYLHQICIADWAPTALSSPLNLLPFDPAGEPFVEKVMSGLSWYETRCFSADGQRLYFASDREAGMLNVNLHYIELASAKRRKVTHDHGVLEGGVISPDDSTLYFSGTRARESGYLTLVTGPSVPPLLGFVAEPTLHSQLAEKFLAPIGNGDVLAVDETYGMGARMVGKRDTVVAKLGQQIEHWLYRTIACSMSPDGRELAVAAISSIGSNIVLLRRKPRSVPPPVAILPTPSPKGAMPLRAAPLPDVDRTIRSDFGGRARIQIEGTVAEGRFQATFDNFKSNGVKTFAGSVDFQTGDGGFRHAADVKRVNFDETEEADTFYRADMRVGWKDVTDGTLDSRSRHGTTSAAWDGTWFANVPRWRAGRRRPEPIPGSQRCRSARRT